MKVGGCVSEWLGLGGATVLIAGAGGLGAACAAGFANVGARVVVTDRDETRLKELDRRLALGDRRGGTHPADLGARGAAARVVKEVVAEYGGIDVLVHCIGINDRRPILELDDGDWSELLETNLSTAFRLGQAAGREMCHRGHGKIVFFSSVAGLLAHKNHGPYAASKGGLNQMMRVMAVEWAASGVTVNAVAPGYVETPLTAGHLSRPGIREDLVRLVPAGRLGTPEETVGPVLFLASKQSGFVTGHVLYVDGGRTLV
jgi:gluconate 5-dehydrogenase